MWPLLTWYLKTIIINLQPSGPAHTVLKNNNTFKQSTAKWPLHTWYLKAKVIYNQVAPAHMVLKNNNK